MLKKLGLSGLVMSMSLWVSPVWAAFGVTVSGDAVEITPPASATPKTLQNMSDGKDLYSVWFESSGNIPEGGLAVDHDGRDGTFLGSQFTSAAFTADLATALPEGKQYRSYFVHFDPKMNYTIPTGPEATLTFGGRIIGISLFTPSLDAGDPTVGAAGTVYPTGLMTKRGLDEKKSNDIFTVSMLGHVLHVDFTANGDGFDQIRVFTVVPELESLAVWLAIGAVIGTGAWWRHRKHSAVPA